MKIVSSRPGFYRRRVSLDKKLYSIFFLFPRCINGCHQHIAVQNNLLTYDVDDNSFYHLRFFEINCFLQIVSHLGI